MFSIFAKIQTENSGILYEESEGEETDSDSDEAESEEAPMSVLEQKDGSSMDTGLEKKNESEDIDEVDMPEIVKDLSEEERESEDIDEVDIPVSVKDLPDDPTRRWVAVMKLRDSLCEQQGILSAACAGRKRGKGKKKGKGGTQLAGKGPFDVPVRAAVQFSSPLFPDRARLPLKFEYNRTLIGGPSVAENWNLNNAFLPLPTGSSGTTPGFADWASIYDFYRVLSYSYTIDFSNMEPMSPVSVFVLNVNDNPGLTPDISDAANPLCHKVGILSVQSGVDRIKGHSPGKRSSGGGGVIHVSMVTGTTAVATADSYRAPVNASPADLTWTSICAQSTIGATLSQGVAYVLEVYQWVEFFGRKQA